MKWSQFCVLIGTVLLADFASAQCRLKTTKEICVGTGPVCTDECDGGLICKAMAAQYGCAQIVTFSNCNNGRCDCTCPPGAPVPAPTVAKTGKCTGRTTSACFSELAQWQIDSVLAKHNELRAKHGACPLVYEAGIAAYSVGSDGFRKSCEQKDLFHNDSPSYAGARLGENLKYTTSNFDVHNWDPAIGAEDWYCNEEACWDYNTFTESQTTGHFTQVIWKATTQVGCGLCQNDGRFGLNIYMICNYGSGGNVGAMGTGGQYEDNVGRYGETASGCAAPPSGTNECDNSPCGTGQICNDPDTTSSNDYTCTCDMYPSIVSTGGQATCETRECDANPCGTDQTCNDPNKASNSLHDFICTCLSDSSVTQVDGPATCSKNECDSSPCDASQSQTCNDPSPTLSSIGDYTCTCPNGVVATGGAVMTCINNECDANPCGSTSEQDCNDPNTASNNLHDFVCSCKSDTSLTRVDGPATCTKNECDAMPCGTQTCVDPDTSLSALNDFTCACANGITAIGGLATCETDECTTFNCGSGQSCNDGNQAANSLHDFECICDNDINLKMVDGPVAACVEDECATSPCGSQTCDDPNQSAASTGDFTCTCLAPNQNVMETGRPATCSMGNMDECTANPCGTSQTCNDPDSTAAGQMDFICTCQVGVGSKVGGLATCVLNECDASPCGSGQDCTDANEDVSSAGDFTCTCRSPNVGDLMGGPAVCVQDECLASPCGPGQMCNDPVKTPLSLLDYVCSCTNGATATGAPATCDIDECVVLTNPCGTNMDQDCNDPNTASGSQHDFVCTCKSSTTITQVDGPATCSKNECDASPCDAGQNQVCNDPLQTVASIGDYTCTCPNGVTSTGGAVSKCIDDECESQPCGSDQDCVDPNTNADVLHDFICSCRADPSMNRTDGPARCGKNECDSKPCEEQECMDPNQSVSSLNDYVCSCANNGPTATGAKANCGVDECLANPCSEGQICTDFDRVANGSFECRCPFGLTHNIGAAVAECDECKQGSSKNPCAWSGHPSVVETCNDPNPQANSLDDFTCTCANGVFKIGGAANCEKTGECAADPCGAHQVCNDPDVNVVGDFICTCEADQVENVGRPVMSCQFDECNPPAGVPPCPVDTQTCTDPDTAPGAKYDFVCRCKEVNGMMFEGEKVGGVAECTTSVCIHSCLVY